MLGVLVKRGFTKCVGFIGLGNMGGPMAANLAKKGKQVLAYDVDKGTCEKYSKLENVMVVSKAEDVADGAGAIITMLPSNPHVREVYLKEKSGLVNAAVANTLFIDCSTIDPAVSLEVNAAAKSAKQRFCDAPVSGGVNAAAAGSLTFMCGADRNEDFKDASTLLSLMGGKIFNCGVVGTGEAAKLANNMLLAISMIGVSETMHLAKNLGIDDRVMSEILSVSSGRCWSVDTYNPVPGVMENVPSSRDYEGGFGSKLMLKDLGLAQSAAQSHKSPTLLGGLAHQIYTLMCKNDQMASKDFGVVYQFLQKK